MNDIGLSRGVIFGLFDLQASADWQALFLLGQGQTACTVHIVCLDLIPLREKLFFDILGNTVVFAKKTTVLYVFASSLFGTI